MLNRQNALIAVLILVAILTRLLPHPPNFAPVAAVALFGGALFTNRSLAFLIPLIIMGISDFLIGFHAHIPVVYGLFMTTVLIGFYLKDRVRPGYILGASIISSILFFLGSNLAVWFGSTFYTQDLSGLITCYTFALPFFHNTIMGDLFYSGVLFGSYSYVNAKYPHLLAPVRA